MVQVEATPVLPRVRSKGPQQEQQKPLAFKVGRLLVLSLLARFGRRTPIVGWFVAPVVSSSPDIWPRDVVASPDTAEQV